MESQIENLKKEKEEFKRLSKIEKEIFKTREHKYILEIEGLKNELIQNERISNSKVRY